MAILTIHHWPDLARGLRELARVSRRRVVILTWVPPRDGAIEREASGVLADGLIPSDPEPFWLTRDYFPEILAHDRTIFPASVDLAALLEQTIGRVRASVLAIPHDCVDGMLCAYWRRPELYLVPERRAAMSSFARISAERGVAKLRADIDDGAWTLRNRDLLDLDALDCGYRIVVCEKTLI